MEPVLSIIMPVYNVERYLAACLESALAQDIPGLEIICVNDGSTDSSPEILQQFAAQDGRIRVINKENAGYGAAMNDGLRAARGTYVGILESDDRVCDGAWQTLLDLAQTNDLDMVRGSYIRCYHGTESLYDPHKGASAFCSEQQPPLPFDEVFDPANFPVCFWVNPSLWTGLYRRSFLADNNLWFTETPGASYQDTAFGFKTWALAKRVMLTETPVILYNRDNEASSSNSKSKVFAICDEAAECECFLAERHLTDTLGAALASLRYRTYHWNAQRVADEFKEDFGEVMERELGADYRAGYCTPEVFKRNDLELIKRMAEGAPAVSVIFAANGSAADNEAAFDCVKAFTNQDIEILYVPCAKEEEPDATAPDDLLKAEGPAATEAAAEPTAANSSAATAAEGASAAKSTTADAARPVPETPSSAGAVASDDPRVRVLSTCISTGQAFNAGLKEARGTYLMFVEAADRPEPRVLEYFVRAADRDDMDAIACRWLHKMGTRPSLAGDPLLDWPRHGKLCSADDPRGFVLRFDTALLANKMFRASFLNGHNFTFSEGPDAVASFVGEALSAADRTSVLSGRVVTRTADEPFAADPNELLSIAETVKEQLDEQGIYDDNALDYQTWLTALYSYGMQVRAIQLASAQTDLASVTTSLARTREKLASAREKAKERGSELKRTQKALAKAEARLEKTQDKLEKTQSDLEKLRASSSFKVGRALTAPARALKRSVNRSGK